ncbi:hypothetical protein RSOLAG1IB_00813 [Rhizoctonia solani AG-1 IB]|uniref:Uncharacterized protein n=1 Tax=Thanatephorus cucumeris (strain AG1-IB / isolate 7/3/14) TaxID=1108050 RepID=A0A0B7F7S3_THACB|nr:hypothetical protein RSOLAG1IB_00813 [Rhizoctonia solani AG-1 IB]
MKRFTYRSAAAIISTLVYLSLLTLDVVQLPSQLGHRSQHNSNHTIEQTHRNSSLLSFDSGFGYSLSSSVWFQPPWKLKLIRSRPPLYSTSKAAPASLRSSPQKMLIGGSWQQSLTHLHANHLNLSSVVTFTSTFVNEIQPSSANGYLNSRIDLRRRRRAFSVFSDGIKPPPIALQFREEATSQPKTIDPLKLREQFENAIVRNRLLREELASRKLRKGKKKNSKVNSNG